MFKHLEAWLFAFEPLSPLRSAMLSPMTHVKLKSALTGTRYAFAGVSQHPYFEVPVQGKCGTYWKVQDVLDHYLVVLNELPDGRCCLCKEKIPGSAFEEIVTSESPVHSVIDRQGQVISHRTMRIDPAFGRLTLQEVADEHGFVNVYFFKHKYLTRDELAAHMLEDELDDPPLMDLSGISTPPTPPPRESSD